MLAYTDRRRQWLGWIVLICCAVVWGALLFPWMTISRVGPRRTQCLNNLKNMALATINFETMKNRYPGYQEVFGNSGEQHKIGSWVVALMPLIEQQALRDQWDDPETQVAWQTAYVGGRDDDRFYPEISLLICPDSTRGPSPRLNYHANSGFYVSGPQDPALELASYAGLVDTSSISSQSQRAANGIFSNQLPAECFLPSANQTVAPFGRSPASVGVTDIRDGLSQTLLFAENTVDTSWRTVSVEDGSSRFHLGILWHYAGDSASAERPKPPPPTPNMLINGNKLIKSEPSAEVARPASMHLGIANCAMADGSVVSLNEKLDYHVYQALLSPWSPQSDMPRIDIPVKEDDWRY